MTKNLLWLACFLLGICYSGVGMGQTASSKVTPPNNNPAIPSAEAASLGRYGDIPVSLHSGVPNIDIPLYTIGLKGMNIPISLSYHAGGIKVDELSGNVGLGWSLNYGGSATKATYGLDDLEDANGWASTAYRFPQTGTIKTDGWPSGFAADPEYMFMKDMQQGELFDTQPDLFYLNMNGRSIKFFFDDTGEIRTIPYSRLKIVPGGLSGVTVTDENDVVYEFAASELTLTSTYNTGSYFTSSIPQSKSFAYYLTKITTPNGEVIDYTYESYSYSFENQISETRYNFGPGGSSTINAFCIPFLPPTRITTSSSSVYGKRITKISSSTGIEVNFTYGLARIDLAGTHALTKIEVKSTIDSEVKVTDNLTYGYNNDRLILLSVTKAGDQPHVFEYDGTLPDRLSKGSDHWGYINTSSTVNQTTTLPIDAPMGFTTGVNKAADAFAMTGLLKKITYPTGGSTQFVFENNKGNLTGPTITNKSAYAIAEAGTTVTEYFTVSGQQALSMRVAYNTPLYGSVYDPITDTYGICNVTIKNEFGEDVLTLSGTPADPLGDQTSLPDGVYSIEIYTRYTAPDFNGAWVNVTWKEEGAITTTLVNGPGVRVKSITNNPVVGASSTKYFEYTLAADPTKSSGYHNVNPIYLSRAISDHINTSGGASYNITCDFLMQNSKSASAIGSMPGGGYTEVTVYEDAKTNGYTHHIFSSPVQNEEYSLVFPQAPQIDNTWVTGQPKATFTYGYNPSTAGYYLLSKTENSYKTIAGVGPNEYSTRGAVSRVKKTGIVADGVGVIDGVPAEYEVAYYRLYSSWTYPTKTVNTVYKALDTNVKIRTETSFYYDNPAHIQLTRQLSNNSNGKQTMVKLRYPQDVNPSHVHLSTPVIEKQIFTKDGSSTKLVDGELTTYRNQAGIFPEYYYGLVLNAPVDSATVAPYNGSTVPPNYQQRIYYNYNLDKNIVSATSDQLKSKGFKWGFAGKLLLAEVTNALDTEVFYEGFEESGTTGSSHTGKKHSGGTYTVNFTKPNGREYVISYWYLDGTWKYTETTYSGPSFALSLGTAYDDVRIHPVDARMATYTHDPLIGITSKTDDKGNTNYFEYDDYKRLLHIKDHQGNIVKSYTYNQAN